MTSYPDHPRVGVGIVVLRGEEVLLIKRGNPPGLGDWNLPGGSQELGETVEQAAHRELLEETGIVASDIRFLDYIDGIMRDEGGRIVFHYTILDFAARWVSGEAVAGSDAADARFVTPEALAEYGLNAEVLRMIGLARAALG